MRKYCYLNFEICLYGCLAFFVVACNSSNDSSSADSDNVPSSGIQAAPLEGAQSQMSENGNSVSNTVSFAPGPVEERFFSNTTSMLEVLVFEKTTDGLSVFVEQVQTEVNRIEEQHITSILDLDSLATQYVGSVSSQGNLLNEIPNCLREFGFGENEFNYIARSTDQSGKIVTFINTDLCGPVPELTFEQIDGQVFYAIIGQMRDILLCTNTGTCDELEF